MSLYSFLNSTSDPDAIYEDTKAAVFIDHHVEQLLVLLHETGKKAHTKELKEALSDTFDALSDAQQDNVKPIISILKNAFDEVRSEIELKEGRNDD